MDMDAVIQFAIIIGIVILGFLGLVVVCFAAKKLLEKLLNAMYRLDTGSVSPFGLARTYIIGIFVDGMIFLMFKDVDHIPLYILLAVLFNCFLLFIKEKNKKRYGLRNIICGVLIFVIAPVLWILLTLCFLLAIIIFSDGKATTTVTSNGGGDAYAGDMPRFEEKFDPVYGKYYSDGNGNMKDANGNDVNSWDKPYWMP